ncbi:ABC transporter permease subunit [Paraburkholderia sp. NMBU_R16]|uniref:carbohydrate ABC transporter permease n=1 Tax=Paraburkholderia sp. NMBU_R16 TaxID=2698676 RepID=UPI001566B4C6|nr:sugar ABC transporter permease [Paraburkholderia sp. NMBU_R16]NRO97946.1 ABC transporter permease subunit [Paraburkholderia sp. NMBU_R16]
MSISITPRASRRAARPATNNRSPLVKRRTRAALCFLLPGLALFTVFVIYPIASSIVLSFHHWDGMTAKTFAGLDNYRELIASDTFYTALKNNLTWLALFLLAPPAGLVLALYLNQNVTGIRLVKSLFFAPFVLPGVVVGLVFSWFYDPTFGLLKLIVGHGIPVLGDPRYVTFGIVFAALWPQIPFCMILYLTGLTAINPEIVEAARMEGAGGWALLWHVILPQLRPATFMAFVLTVIGALRSFDLISVMSGGGPFDSSTVLAYFMYDQAIKYYREGYSAAIAVVLFAIMLVYIAWQLRRLVRTDS